MVGGGAGKGNALLLIEDWHYEGHVGPMAGARIGIVMHNHVTRHQGITARLQEA